MALTSTHWGVYDAIVKDGQLKAMQPRSWDPDPSPLGASMPEGIVAPCRIARPAIRESFLRNPAVGGEGRGREPFVEVDWETALDLVAQQIERVRSKFGPAAIYGGSYGWSSAGRFHHAQSQIRRFLTLGGGYTESKDSYSVGAARVLLPYIVGNYEPLSRTHTDWSTLIDHTQLFVAFGGLPAKNMQNNAGGASHHFVSGAVAAMQRKGIEFINVSPSRADMKGNVTWLSIRPGTDTALMLALAYVLQAEDLVDQSFLEKYSVGYDQFHAYLVGKSDGVAKDPRWAAAITGINAEQIVFLARRMGQSRTMINCAWALQRAEHGEQPFWMMITLAAMLGQIGLPGGGFGIGYGCSNGFGAGTYVFSGPKLPSGGPNADGDWIPVARISDMLLNPGHPYSYQGVERTYPDVRLVYWAGGNLFHHHQDINKLIRAWRIPQVTVCQDLFWTSHAKFSDIVLPATSVLERADIGSANHDWMMISMEQAIAPIAEARDDYEIFAQLAERLGFGSKFTENRTAAEWQDHIYEVARERARQELDIVLPSYSEFRHRRFIDLGKPIEPTIMLSDFRTSPQDYPLSTPSGLIEITSSVPENFQRSDLLAHPAWYEPSEWLGSSVAQTYPLHLLSNQPATRLHSQYDHTGISAASKIAGREPIRINPDDAAQRQIQTGDVVRAFNARGQLLAGALIDDTLMAGVVQIATGAWYDPLDPGTIGTLDKHGNPNVLTQDIASSAFSQGCSAQTALVQVEKYEEAIPEITAHHPPKFAVRNKL